MHEHGIDIGPGVGSMSLRIVLLGLVSLVACSALLRPFLPERLGMRLHWVAAAAGAGVLVSLLLADGTAVPRQVVALLVLAALPPVYCTYRDVPAVARHTAPYVLALAAVGAGVLFTRSLLAGAGPDTAPALSAGVALTLVGLSWHVLCLHRSRRAAALSAAGAWLLGAAAVAGAGQLAMLTMGAG